MAITGLITGYLSMVLAVVLLAAVAVPVYPVVSERGASTKAMANAKQIGLALKLYAGDNDGHYPKSVEQLFPSYLQNRDLFICPLDSNKEPMGYDYLGQELTDDMTPKAVLLQSKVKTREGRRVVVHLDDSVDMEVR